MKLPSFDDQWPVRVELNETGSEPFYWLHKQLINKGIDYREVYTTMGNRTVAFKEDHKRLAAMFKLKFG